MMMRSIFEPGMISFTYLNFKIPLRHLSGKVRKKKMEVRFIGLEFRKEKGG